MKKEMLINVLQPEEIRIAIIEDGVLEELYVERTSHESYVGNIYKGRIVNIEPSIQAAFVDFGVGRNGFLHVSDVEPAYYRHLEQGGDRHRNGQRGSRDRPERGRPAPRLPYAEDDDLEDARSEWPSAPPKAIAGAPLPQDEFPEGGNSLQAPSVIAEATPWPDNMERPGHQFGAGLDDPPAATPAPLAAEDAAPPAEEEDSGAKKARRGRRGRKPRAKQQTEAAPEGQAPDAPQSADDGPSPMPSAERRTDENDPAPEPLEAQDPLLDEELSFSMAAPRRTLQPKEEVPSAPLSRAQAPSTAEARSGTPRHQAPLTMAEESLGFSPAPPAAEEPAPAWKEPYLDEPALAPSVPENEPPFADDEAAIWRSEEAIEQAEGEEEMPEVEIRELGGDDSQPIMGRSAEEIRADRPREQTQVRDFPPSGPDEVDETPYRDRPRGGRDDRPRGGRDDRPRGGRDDRPRGGRDDRPRGGRDDRRGDRGGSSGGPRRMMGGRPGAGRPKPLIQDIFKRGQEVLVQVIKEGIGTKGPTLSTYISIAGRYLVLMPGLARIGVSRKIQDDESRRRLRDIMNELQPPKGLGFIIRTAGIDRNKKELQTDLDYLSKIWHVVVRRIRKTKSPADIYQESDMVTRTIRDIFTSEIDTIYVDEPAAFEKAKEFLQGVMPRYANRIQLYDKPEPMFHKYGIEDEIARIQQRHVPLPMGGSIVIDQAEACVAIDVNSGNFRADNNAEETAYQMNLQAAKEIARQLRLRDLGGVIVNDFIDMRDEKHRRAVEKALRDAVKRDRARTKILKISQFGIIEMTRQRIRPSLKRSVYMECPHCKGTSHVKTSESMSIDVMRLVQLAAGRDVIQRIDIRVHQDVAHYLLNRKRGPLAQLEAQGDKQISVRGEGNVPPEFLEFLCLDNNGHEVKFLAVDEAPPPRVYRR